MKKINYITILMVTLMLVFVNACNQEFLEVNPNGGLDANVLATETGVNGLLIGAYAMLDGTSASFGWQAAASNWVYGSIRGGEANKGTDSGDQPDINPLMNYTETASNPYLNVRWRSLYESIARCNEVINVGAVAVAAGALDDATYALFVGQARALRGHYHVEAIKLWGNVPYVDEETDPTTVTNTADITDLVLADLAAGLSLPTNMSQTGRFNKTVVQVLLAKATMQLKGDYTTALGYLNSAKGGTAPDGSAIGLEDNYGDIFDIEFRNGKEAVYTVQYSVNDGSGGINAGTGEVLNFPYKGGGSPGGCCGFFQPSQEFVNSFRTNADGLPLLDGSYNNDPVLNDQGLAIDATNYVLDPGNLDPRLDWSVGRRGIPYLDWGPHTGQDWIRDQSYAGPFSPKKQVYKKAQEGQFTEVGNWTSGYTANGYRMIRYADILLLAAECQAQTGDLAGALANVNLVRARAANESGWVKNEDGTNAAKYVIGEYTSFSDKATALSAILMERKLELGQEGHRWFDLKRFGVSTTAINSYLTYSKTLGQTYITSSTSYSAGNDLFPIPQRQIDLSNGALVQN
ncbi:MAG: RagB/SusD family nutrient uptake outer membrane protein [Flammeovirgaceae bacterium]|jgi:starch-binding outer membrane protein, SusD/RagB family|nr:RagB/SusD family nutrient uptake outer membrane protein [Flammeovirgaceae bacterium]